MIGGAVEEKGNEQEQKRWRKRGENGEERGTKASLIKFSFERKKERISEKERDSWLGIGI